MPDRAGRYSNVPGAHTQAGSLVGTPAFIAPEQAIGEIERVNERSDVFGLEALLAVILTGQPPYVGATFEGVRVQAVRGTLEDCFARLDASGAEPELVALCKQCLAFEPADRPPAAGAVARPGQRSGGSGGGCGWGRRPCWRLPWSAGWLRWWRCSGGPTSSWPPSRPKWRRGSSWPRRRSRRFTPG